MTNESCWLVATKDHLAPLPHHPPTHQIPNTQIHIRDNIPTKQVPNTQIPNYTYTTTYPRTKYTHHASERDAFTQNPVQHFLAFPSRASLTVIFFS